MCLADVLDTDQNVIQIYYNKDIKLFNKNPIDIALKTVKYIKKFEEHHLVLKVIIFNTKNHLSFVTFLNPYPVIDIDDI